MSLSKKWGFSYEDMYLHYNSKQDKAIPVPLYIWKVSDIDKLFKNDICIFILHKIYVLGCFRTIISKGCSYHSNKQSTLEYE